ncbi:DUF3347 domain-containing protein [Mucilaginibacter pedocola]|uniref:DUF3347 domain-containing protein n=1 Tax=Mucilaginibacter pedocola TaxID=1792845 RepID=A0A1S9PLZ0_9SPHI|nr:DUF3347 domain-containing protein [Mucilaginibacter pedocola]OOQ61986.1 hypothetical protein BC343_02720 [Mucilaginibacter pedocola]
MKKPFIIFPLAVTVFAIAACNLSGRSADSVAGNDTAKTSAAGITPSTTAKILVAHYLNLKNALAKDNSNAAATAGKSLADGFAKFDRSTLNEVQKKNFADIADDAQQMAKHIGESAGKLPHQREHFDMLSKDMYDMVKLFGASQPLYVDRCPMYNDKKGAIWLSETKAISNPYFGTDMPTCGTIKEELK